MSRIDYLLAIAMMLVLGFVCTYTLWRIEEIIDLLHSLCHL